MSSLDAALAGAAGGQQFQDVGQRYGNLLGALSAGGQATQGSFQAAQDASAASQQRAREYLAQSQASKNAQTDYQAQKGTYDSAVAAKSRKKEEAYRREFDAAFPGVRFSDDIYQRWKQMKGY